MDGIPAQVEEAANLAEQLHAKMFEQPEVTEDTQEVAPDETEEVETDESEEVVPHDDDLEELRKFKSRYMSLKGKYDAEVPRLSQELRELKTSVFEKLQAPAKAEPTTEPEAQTSDFLNDFAENYGEDFAENLRKLIALEASKLTQPIKQQVEATEETQVKTAQSNFVNYIDTQLNEGREKPVDWQGLWSGKDPKFVEFLAQPDPSGLYTMGELAELYNQNWEADKLVNIFKMYTDSNTQNTPKPKTVSVEKQAMVAPSRTNTHTAPDTQAKKIWTAEMVQEFERADRQGKYSPEQSKAMWDDLLTALAENRIR